MRNLLEPEPLKVCLLAVPARVPPENLEVSEQIWLILRVIILVDAFLFKTFLAVVPSILRSRVAIELENLAVRHQIGGLQRSAAKPAKLTSGDLLDVSLSPLA